jgi:hypothetical protein
MGLLMCRQDRARTASDPRPAIVESAMMTRRAELIYAQLLEHALNAAFHTHVEEGTLADLMLVDGNPSANITLIESRQRTSL